MYVCTIDDSSSIRRFVRSVVRFVASGRLSILGGIFITVPTAASIETSLPIKRRTRVRPQREADRAEPCITEECELDRRRPSSNVNIRKLKRHRILRIGATHSCARTEISTAHSDRSLFLLANNVGGVFSVANSRFASIQLAAINIKLLRSSVMWLVAARVWWCARRQNFDRRRVCGQVLLAARGPISHIN